MSNPALPPAVTSAIDALSDLPGIGNRSAERLVLTLIKNKTGLSTKIAQSLGNLDTSVTECDTCHHLCQASPNGEPTQCDLCTNPARDTSRLCIVSSPSDLIALERTHQYRGRYHVLHGVISPLHRVRPEDIRLGSLLERIEREPIQEIIFALPASTEAEATTLYIQDKLPASFTGTITRLAQGIPSGGMLDYLDAHTLGRALSDRRVV